MTMRENNATPQHPVRQPNPLLRLLCILLVIILILMGITGMVTYRKTASKYQQEIDRLEEELALAQAPTVVYEEEEELVDLKLLNSEIQGIGELATVEYLYTDVAHYTSSELFGMDMPFEVKSFIIRWDGVIKAGVDITKVTVRLDALKKEIIVSLPPASILSHETDSDSYETLDENNNTFNPISIDDMRMVDAEGRAAIEARAVGNGLLEDAMENAKSVIRQLITANPTAKDSYSVVFEVIEE